MALMPSVNYSVMSASKSVTIQEVDKSLGEQEEEGSRNTGADCSVIGGEWHCQASIHVA